MAPQEISHKNTAAGRPVVLAVTVLLIPLVFSAEIVEAITNKSDKTTWSWWLLVAADASLLTLALLVTAYHWKRNWFPGKKFVALWLIGSFATIALDIPITRSGNQLSIATDIAISFGYVAALAVILSATVGYNPLTLFTKRSRMAHRPALTRFLVAVPLLFGTLGAYMASTLWRVLGTGVNRTVNDITLPDEEWMKLEAEGYVDRATYIESLCSSAIDQEYFAQVSQVVPLLLVALGLEAKFFRKLTREPAGRALTLNAVLFLIVGEMLALSTLPASPNGCGKVLYGWHEYIAFIVTIESCVIALTTLAWALIFYGDEPDLPRESIDPKEIPKVIPETLLASANKEIARKSRPERKDVAFGAGIILLSLISIAVSRIRSRR